MILKALYDYYHRRTDLPPLGMELKEIEYIIVLNAEGEFQRFESTRIDKKRCASFMVAKGVSRTSAPLANCLWDNGKYVLGNDIPNELFVHIINEIAQNYPEDASLAAIVKFYQTPQERRELLLSSDPLWNEVSSKLSANFTFRLEGEEMTIAEKRELIPSAMDSNEEKEGHEIEGICLVTGDKGPIARITTATALPGNSPGAAIVSIQKSSGYDSYGKSQAYNSPISIEAEAAYSAALKALLAKDSRNKVRIGERMFLFWSNSDTGAKMEECTSNLLTFEINKEADPIENLSNIRKMFKGIWSGEIKTTLDERFYILGLAPNVGRIAVVEWEDIPLKEFAYNILQHFEDMEIVDSRPADKRRPFYGVFSMISNVTLGGKTSDALPSLIEAVFSSVMENNPYPYPLYTSALDRIRAELSDYTVTPGRAAILKAYINRKHKFDDNIKPLTVMLDKTNDNPAYLCGRLAAVLERIQDTAGRGDSIRTRYLAAASATPSTVFPAMLNLSIHHSENLKQGSFVYYEKLKDEILSMLPASGFPARFNINDQGRFFVGYYHQRADLFTKKDTEQQQ